MDSYYETHFINRKVQLWPGDTDSKYGTIIAASSEGIILRMTESRSYALPAGSDYFIPWSGAKLRFVA